MNKVEEKVVEKIVSNLEGSCTASFDSTFEYVVSELSEDERNSINRDKIELATYERVDTCSVCGWWFNTMDLTVSSNGCDLVCIDCFDDEDEEAI